jgi:hypothetical protein
MKKDFAGKMRVGFYAVTAGLWGCFLIQAVAVVLMVGNPAKLKQYPGFMIKPAPPPAYESIRNDPEALRHTALNHWIKEFHTDGSLLFVKGAAGEQRVSEAPFGRPARESERVESLSKSRGMDRSGIQHRELMLHQAVEAHAHHTMILPVYVDGQLVSQWTYDIRRQILAGRETDLENPAQAHARIGFLGCNGLVQSRAEADAFGDFVRCRIISQPAAGDTNLLLWQTTESIYVLDLHHDEILLHKPWPFRKVDISHPGMVGRSGELVPGIDSAVVEMRTWSGEWVVFMRSVDGVDRVFQGSGLTVPGRFGVAGNKLYFQEFNSEQWEKTGMSAEEQTKRTAELLSRPWKEWAALYRVDPNGTFALVKRHEWMRDPLQRTKWADPLPNHTLWLHTCLIRGTRPPVYALLNHQLADLRRDMMDSRIPRSRWTEFKLKHFESNYTHWQLLWTAAALGGLFLYQRKRKLNRGSFAAWGLMILALGLPGLLACWIACHGKRERTPSVIAETPQYLLITQ